MHLSTYLQQSPRGEGAELARRIGVPRPLIYQWAKRTRACPPVRCVALEKETFGQVLRECMHDNWRSLWPDLIPLRRVPVNEAAVAA
jgi:DNA-binding transcriptional regulator YdaS (Cro superfamily)